MRRRGDLAEAISAAASQGPADVRDLAARAQVGYGAARYTASRMLARGELCLVAAGRPAVLALPEPDEPPLQGGLSFWDRQAVAAC